METGYSTIGSWILHEFSTCHTKLGTLVAIVAINCVHGQAFWSLYYLPLLGPVLPPLACPCITFPCLSPWLFQTFGTILWQAYFQRVLSVRSAGRARMLLFMGGEAALVLVIPSVLIGRRRCRWVTIGEIWLVSSDWYVVMCATGLSAGVFWFGECWLASSDWRVLIDCTCHSYSIRADTCRCSHTPSHTS
jgi:hypothetical protein